jgi:hypothetical protein
MCSSFWDTLYFTILRCALIILLLMFMYQCCHYPTPNLMHPVLFPAFVQAKLHVDIA